MIADYSHLDPNIEKFIEAHENEFIVKDLISGKYFPLFGISQILPQFYVKSDDIDRLDGRQILLNAIHKYGLNHLDVADKYIYTFKNYPMTGRQMVLSRVIDSHTYISFTSDEIHQLKIIREKTGFFDMNFNIIRRASDGKLVFIDTQLSGFAE